MNPPAALPASSTPSVDRAIDQEVAEVSAIELAGSPRFLLLDDGAVFTVDGTVPEGLRRKLVALAVQDGMQIWLVSPDADKVKEALGEIPRLGVSPSVAGVPWRLLQSQSYPATMSFRRRYTLVCRHTF